MSNPPKSSPKRPSPIKNIGRYLKVFFVSPYGLAALASLSFHVVLFAAIPRFSSVSFAAFDEEDGNTERTVPLVTLSPAEQGRLPNFNRPQLPSIPSITSSIPPRTSLNTLPNPSIFNPSNLNNNSNLDRYRSRSTSPSTSSSSRLSRNRPFRNPYIPRPNFPIRNTPTQSDRIRTRQEQRIEVPPQPTIVDLENLNIDADILKRQQEIEQRQAEESQQNLSVVANEVPEGLPDLPPPSEGLPELPPQGEEPIAASEENTDQTVSPEEPVIATKPELSPQQLQLARLLDTLEYNDEAANISQEQVDADYAAWATNIEEATETPAVDVEDKGTLPVAMGSNLCLDNAPQVGEVAVLVTPDGTPSDTTLLRSTGYDQRDQDALTRLSNQDYPAAETALRYRFNVIVEDYDADKCTSIGTLQGAVPDPELSSTESSDADPSSP